LNSSLVETDRAGRRGVAIARYCWPHLKLTVSGGAEDKKGTDGYGFGLFGEDRVQIKFDGRIAESGNIYHEVYEKTRGRPDQQWRASPHQAKWYIFTTVGHAWLAPTDALAQIENGLRLTRISDTSMGFLFPEERLQEYGCQYKEHSL